MMTSISSLLAGAIDLHVHCAPDAFSERSVDALELAQQASSVSMKAVVIKSHQFCTAPLAKLVNKLIGHSILLGSVVLNYSVGGLNADAVAAAAKEGAKLVWMPTLSAREHIEAHRAEKKDDASRNKSSSDFGISIIGQDAKLVPQVMPILDIIKSNNLVLATGHISLPEVYAITNEAIQRKIKVVITHPFDKPFGESITVDKARELADRGAFIELCFNVCMPARNISPSVLVDHIRAVGVEHCVLSTDLGQIVNPAPTEGFRIMLAHMLRAGLREDELEILVKSNPAQLLALMS